MKPKESKVITGLGGGVGGCQPVLDSMEKVEISEYKASIPLEARRLACEQAVKAHPGMVPVIVLKSKTAKFQYYESSRHLTQKYFLPRFILNPQLSIGTLLYALRKSLKLHKNQGFYLFLDQLLPHLDAKIGELHQRFRAEDGFLYLVATQDVDKGGDAGS